ncbi:MAG: VOC family protein [Deltaproteobacteria bacterium]|nr:VOC family protein [Deltaproteobacteria bacterium]
MAYRLDHIAINCKDLQQSIQFNEKFMNGTPTPIRKGGGGEFCFMNITGAPSVQLIASNDAAGINHYGFVTDNIDGTAAELKSKGAEIIREIRDQDGKLTTIFVKDCNGLSMEVRIPR